MRPLKGQSNYLFYLSDKNLGMGFFFNNITLKITSRHEFKKTYFNYQHS